MASWLTDLGEAKKRPVLTLTTMMLAGFVALALIDYYAAATHSLASAAAVGAGGAAMIGFLLGRAMWPERLDRPLRGRPRTSVSRGLLWWSFPIVCFCIGGLLIIVGIVAPDAGVAVSGLPFLIIGSLILWAKKR